MIIGQLTISGPRRSDISGRPVGFMVIWKPRDVVWKPGVAGHERFAPRLAAFSFGMFWYPFWEPQIPPETARYLRPSRLWRWFAPKFQFARGRCI